MLERSTALVASGAARPAAPAAYAPCRPARPAALPAQVECQGSLTRGMTVFDWQGQWGKAPNVVLVKELDMGRFCDMMMAAVSC
jgi:inosine-uridine nucleoside N-ribohydrolase